LTAGHIPDLLSLRRIARLNPYLCKAAEICVYVLNKKNRTADFTPDRPWFPVAFASKCNTWRNHMTTKRELYLGTAAIALALALVSAPTSVSAQ
jgi:hypothetical protein